MAKDLHNGHRDRMRARILANGVRSLQNHEMLEYVLYAFVPRRDTNELAHALIAEFGSFAGVLNADIVHLTKVSGISQNTAIFLSSLADIFRRYAVDSETKRTSLKGRGKSKDFMKNMLYGCTTEQVYVTALDASDNLIKCEKLAVGTGDSVILSVREIVDFALKYKACGILLAHNHPSGGVLPSNQDYILTREIAWTLQSVDCTLQDHYIFGGGDYFSFDEAGKIQSMREERNISLNEGMLFYE